MKRAKMILTAVGVLAVVGGAVAFKASRDTFQYFTPGVNNWCTVPVALQYTTNFADRTTNFTTTLAHATTLSQNATCGPLIIYPGE